MVVKEVGVVQRASIMAAAAIGVVLMWSGSATANWLDPHVDLNGNASCNAEHADMVNISLDNGEVAAAIPNNYGMYFISFFRISISGTNGTAYTRAASDHRWCSKRITVTRPFSGTVQYLPLNM